MYDAMTGGHDVPLRNSGLPPVHPIFATGVDRELRIAQTIALAPPQ
jgi:hypothetical protein